MPAPPLSAELCAEAIATWEAHGRNQSAAAAALGISRTTFQNRLRTARAREEGDTGFGPGGIGTGPERDGLDPYVVKGVSTYFNADGEQRGQWVKTKIDDQRRAEAIRKAIEDRAARITPLAPVPLEKPHLLSNKLLNLVTITDYHIGMLAWHREGGDDWDVKIARETFRQCFGGMLALMPEAETCVINQLGDFLHTDGLVPVTPAHGNVLDADSRFQKMASIATDLLEELVLLALERHARVHVVLAEGNHDESSSAWLRIMFRRIFRDEPRVTVDDSPLPYYAYQHGKTMLAFHHGHKLKPTELPSLFAAEFSKMWGDTVKRYCHTGHQHHVDEKEGRGMTTLQHPTLAARDAYAARGGWIAERKAVGITYHADTGEAGRTIITPEMFGL